MKDDGVPDEKISEYYKILLYGVNLGYKDGFYKGYGTGYRQIEIETLRSEEGSVRSDRVSEEQEREPTGDDRTPTPPDERNVRTREFKAGIYKPMNAESIEKEDGDLEVEISLTDRREVFGLTCHISNDFYLAEGDFLSPASMKFDIDILNYPYIDNNTDIAILMDVVVKSSVGENISVEDREISYERSRGFVEDEKEVRIGSSNFKGFFSWSNVATCDGVERDVNVERTHSIIGSGQIERGIPVVNSNGIIMTYSRSETINHDPKIGFIEVLDQSVYEKAIYSDDASQVLQSNITMFLASTLVVLLFVAVTWRARRRR